MGKLTEAKASHVECRSLGHAWRPSMVRITTNTRGRPVEYRPHLICIRCETLKVVTMTTTGDLKGSRYAYPDGYLQRGKDRFGRQEVRTEFVRRWLGEHPMSEQVGALAALNPDRPYAPTKEN